jgi:hypothetical protein
MAAYTAVFPIDLTINLTIEKFTGIAFCDEGLGFAREAIMAFSDDTIIKAWNRAKGRCECRRKTHKHYPTRCNKQLVYINRGLVERHIGIELACETTIEGRTQ